MKCPFKVGDVIEEISKITWCFGNNKPQTTVRNTGRLATVTKITERGFEYEYHEPYVMHPRLNLVFHSGEVYEDGYDRWRLKE